MSENEEIQSLRAENERLTQQVNYLHAVNMRQAFMIEEKNVKIEHLMNWRDIIGRIFRKEK